MKSKRILGIDIDGCLADWNSGYYEVLKQVTGKDLCPGPDRLNPPVWLWPLEFGYTMDEFKTAVAVTEQDPSFWMSLNPLPATERFLEDIQFLQHTDIYFITTRAGLMPKWQTEQWLAAMGMEHPTVLLAQSPQAKGAIAAGLGLTHFLDDRDKNCAEVLKASPETQVFLLDRRYNRASQPELTAAGARIATDIWTFYGAVAND